MDEHLVAAAILVVAAAPLALWARMAQSGRWIDVIVPESEGLTPRQRNELAPSLSAGLWLHCALLLAIPMALLLLPESAFKLVATFVVIAMPLLSATGAVLLKRRIRAMKATP
jgi:hypothetical protein